MVIRRGDIWWSSLPDPVGSSPGYPRPVLVVQSDRFNESAINTVVIAVITKNLRLTDSEGNVPITKVQSGLPHDSVINVSQLFTVDESVVRDFVCSITDRKMKQVDVGLRKVLGL